MSDPDSGSRSFIARLTRDPVALRKRSLILAAGIGALSALAGSGWAVSETVSSALLALGWLLAPLAAAGIGIGDAFFVRHGIGQRRVALTLVVTTLAALASCIVLAVVNTGDDNRPLLNALFYFVLMVSVIGWLAAGIAIGVGRGERYLSRKIQDVDDRGW